MRSDLLFITDRRFWRPSIGSEQRVAALIEYAAERGDAVHVAYLGRANSEDKSQIAAFCRPFPRLKIETRSLAHTIRAAVPGLPPHGNRSQTLDSAFPALGAGSPARRRFVESVLRAQRPRVVIVSMLRLVHTVYPRPRGLEEDTQFVVDAHDLIHQRAERYRAAGASVAREISPEEEMRAFQTFDAVLAIQNREGSLIQRALPDARILVVPHGLKMPPLPDSPRSFSWPAGSGLQSETRPIRLGFLGGRPLIGSSKASGAHSKNG